MAVLEAVEPQERIEQEKKLVLVLALVNADGKPQRHSAYLERERTSHLKPKDLAGTFSFVEENIEKDALILRKEGTERELDMRIQLELPEENVSELKKLMAEAHIDTYKELFSNALTLLHWAVQEVKKGQIITSLNEREKKYKELAMPVLQIVAKATAATAGQAFVGASSARQARAR